MQLKKNSKILIEFQLIVFFFIIVIDVVGNLNAVGTSLSLSLSHTRTRAQSNVCNDLIYVNVSVENNTIIKNSLQKQQQQIR